MNRRRSGCTAIYRLLNSEPLESKFLLTGDAIHPSGEGGLNEQVAEFALPDVNPTSETYDQLVSPSNFIGQVSAWYFGHAT